MTTIVPFIDTIKANGSYFKRAPANTAYSPIDITVNVPANIRLSGVQIGTAFTPFKNLLLWSTTDTDGILLPDGYMYFAYNIETSNIRFYFLKNDSGRSLSFNPPYGIKFIQMLSDNGEVNVFQTTGSQNLRVMTLFNNNTLYSTQPEDFLISSDFFDLELS